MFKYIMTKTQYKRLFDGITKNFTICSSSKHQYQNKITTDKFVRLDENSLQPRILKYFKECVNSEQKFNNIVNESNCWNNLNNLNNSDLCAIILNLSENSLPRRDFKNYLKYLDKECCSRLNVLTTPEIYDYLHNFIICMPHIITKLSFYSQAIYKLSFKIEHSSKIELLQLCFYVSLQKKTRESKLILKDCLKKFNYQYINHLNTNDLVILCNSSYKTSTKIEYRKLIDKIIRTIYNNLDILKDTTIFITLIKSLRQNQSQDEELLSTISNTIFFNKTIQNYNFTASTHILALYADSLHFDTNLFSLLIDNCLIHLKETNVISKEEYFARQVRVKDIARFLWSLSYVNYRELDDTIIYSCIVPLLQRYINLGELEKNIEYFLDSLLSMWVMGYKPEHDFFTSIITKNMVALIYGKGKKRYSARLNLLLTCVQWENSSLLPASLTSTKQTSWNQNSQMRNRPYLKILLNALNNICSNVNVNKFEYSSPVPHLNIIGVSGYDKSGKILLDVELIDDLMKVKNVEDTPHGLMSLKIRLLKTLNKPILIVYKENIETMNQLQIEKYLQRKISILNY